MEWLGHVAEAWKDTPPHPSVAAFALQLAGAMLGDPVTFRCVQSLGMVDRFLACLGPVIERNGLVVLAYNSLLLELLKHDEGCCWVMETGVWWKVVKPTVESKCMQACRECHKLFGTLLVKLQSMNDCKGCTMVINHVLEGLRLVKVNSQGNALNEEDDTLLVSCLPFLCSVLEAAMLDTGATVALILLQDRDLEPLMWYFIKLTDDEVFIGRLLKVLVLRYFLLFKKTDDCDPPMTHILCFKTKIFDIISYLSAKCFVKSILYLCFECLMYFHMFDINCVKFKDKSKLYELKDQILLFEMLPVLCHEKKYNTTNDLFVFNFVQSLFDITCEDTIRLAYPFKDHIMHGTNVVESDYSKYCLIYILQLGKYLDKKQMARVCQALIYTLKNIMTLETEDYVIKRPDVVAMVVDALSNFLDSFQISWKEGVECTSLFTHVEMLLRMPSLSPNVTVKALRLMRVTVRNYLPPNLALLVDTMGGSAIEELGPLLHRRLHDVSWDVRDSALELLHTVADVSHLTFPAFQDHVMEHGLCSLCLALAMEDDESYVRASALKCLATMLRVPKYWDDCLSTQDLPTKTMSILTGESEGLVRKEAALLMKEIYQHHNIPKSVEADIFTAMVSAATRDLYWEVKINALSFWERVIEQQMSHQGMIDGRFPSVTFSRENRKIVTLTNNEVRSRINKALEELGRLGCLQVLLSAIHDCDLQVVCKAVDITSALSSLLLQYSILPAEHVAGHAGMRLCIDLTEDDVPLPLIGEVHSEGCPDFGPTDVIESIVNEMDITLLSEVYHNKTNVSSSSPNSTVVPMEANNFLLSLSNINLQDLVSERKKWIENSSESLSCLLDDMLFTYCDPETNVADCY